jgi:cytochrome c553
MRASFRRARVCFWPGVAFVSALLAVSPLEVGQPVPPVEVGQAPKTSRLDRMTQDGPVAVLWRSTAIASDDCKPLDKAKTRLAGDKVRFLVLSTGHQGCAGKVDYIVPVQPSQLELLGEPGSSWRLAIVDSYGIVRIIQVLPEGASGIEQATTIATDWEGGRQSFITNCGHCHGNDGADLSYSGIKTLAGIARRMKGEQILEGGQQSGAVDMTAWSQGAKDALLLYIAGL